MIRPDIGKEIERVLRHVIDEEITKEVEDCQNRIEQRVRGRVAQIVTRVFEVMTFERFGETITIKVDFKNVGNCRHQDE